MGSKQVRTIASVSYQRYAALHDRVSSSSKNRDFSFFALDPSSVRPLLAALQQQPSA